MSHYVDGTTAGDDEAGSSVTMRDELDATIIYANDSRYYANETAYQADGSIYMKPEVTDLGILCNSTAVMCNNVNVSVRGDTIFNKEAYS